MSCGPRTLPSPHALVLSPRGKRKRLEVIRASRFASPSSCPKGGGGAKARRYSRFAQRRVPE
eukprot:7186930-Pyramimonas_sp.AAC.1